MTDLPPTGALPPSSKPPRWWPLFAILAGEAAWLAWVWQAPAVQRQQQVLKTAGGLIVAGAMLLGWLLLFSRLPRRVRLAVLLLLVCPLVVGASLFRLSGVTGDMIPVFTPRWKSSPLVTEVSVAPKDLRLPEGFAGYPQFLGPSRDGLIPGPALARDWGANPPVLLWRVPVGGGFAGTAIAGSKVVSLEQLGENETVVCRDLFSGAVLWSHEEHTRFENSVGGVGPRTTPAIAGERVFTVGANGHLLALELSTGRVIWKRDILADANASLPSWGVSGSPLVIQDSVFVHPGGRGHSLAAYRVTTGEPLWAGGDAGAGYGSPQLVTLLDVPQILIFNGDGVAAHSPADGKVLWTYPWNPSAQHVSDPRVISPSGLVISTGYGAGTDRVELSRDEQGAWKPSRVWHSQRLKSKFASLVVREGFVYGLDDGRITCLDLASGEPKWRGERVGHGQVLRSGDLLVVTAENGEVLLLDLQNEGKERGRLAALSGKMWNPPALASPFLVVRTEGEMACYRLPVAE